ncbi:hypothetical protein GQ53DRAFT_318250 [Thozetella sp. PMI_491]|nr:hypothetical protein GQ53DRAFT_318250 [Thozetella sp. PMI_491]
MPRWLRVCSQSHAPHSFWTPWAPACPSHGGGTEPRCASRRPAFGTYSRYVPRYVPSTPSVPPKGGRDEVFAFSRGLYLLVPHRASSKALPPPCLCFHPHQSILVCPCGHLRARFDPRNHIAISRILSLGTAHSPRYLVIRDSLPPTPRDISARPPAPVPSLNLSPRTN